MKTILLLGSGELGREIAISGTRLGCKIVAVDNKEGASAFSVASENIVIDMTNEDELYSIIEKIKPDYIIPEIEALNIDALEKAESNGYYVIPSASAIRFTMNRRNIREKAINLGIRTAKSFFVDSYQDFKNTIENNFKNTKFVTKPLMSSSGKGQSILNSNWNEGDLISAWNDIESGGRVSGSSAIIEEFIDFDYEITSLFVNTKFGSKSLNEIVHYQEDGDFRWSHHICNLLSEDQKREVETISQTIVKEINGLKNGYGIYGMEFFVLKTGEIVFSELSPRPHDTGMVTLKSQNYSEFDLHIRAIMGMNIPQIVFDSRGTFCVTINHRNAEIISNPSLDSSSMDIISSSSNDLIWFNKSSGYGSRRLGILLGHNLKQLQQINSLLRIV